IPRLTGRPRLRPPPPGEGRTGPAVGGPVGVGAALLPERRDGPPEGIERIDVHVEARPFELRHRRLAQEPVRRRRQRPAQRRQRRAGGGHLPPERRGLVDHAPAASCSIRRCSSTWPTVRSFVCSGVHPYPRARANAALARGASTASARSSGDTSIPLTRSTHPSRNRSSPTCIAETSAIDSSGYSCARCTLSAAISASLSFAARPISWR